MLPALLLQGLAELQPNCIVRYRFAAEMVVMERVQSPVPHWVVTKPKPPIPTRALSCWVMLPPSLGFLTALTKPSWGEWSMIWPGSPIDWSSSPPDTLLVEPWSWAEDVAGFLTLLRAKLPMTIIVVLVPPSRVTEELDTLIKIKSTACNLEFVEADDLHRLLQYAVEAQRTEAVGPSGQA